MFNTSLLAPILIQNHVLLNVIIISSISLIYYAVYYLHNFSLLNYFSITKYVIIYNLLTYT